MCRMRCIGLLLLSIVSIVSVEVLADLPSPEVVQAQIMNRQGQTVGKAQLTLSDHGGLLRVTMWNMPVGWHGMHFHAVGDCSDPEYGFMRSGGHLDLVQRAHGVHAASGYHTGDLANVYAHEVAVSSENATMAVPQVQVEQVLPWVNRTVLTQSFSLVIHESPDDYVSSPTGNAGARIACGVCVFS